MVPAGNEASSLKRQPRKMIKHTETIRRLLLTNCLNAFDHFVGLAIKGLKSGSHPPKKFVFIKICLTENPLKMIKSAFLFHLKSSQDI